MQLSVRRSLRFVLPAALGLALAACAASEPLPALVAKSEAGTYGYSETKLSNSRYDIVYESPSFSVPLSEDDREARLAKERQRAYDFALWRAAEQAKAQGYAAVVVEMDRRDADVRMRSEPVHRPWPGFYPYYGYPYYRYGYSPWGYDPWPDYGYRRWAFAQITVSLEVRFLESPTEESLPVDETLSRLKATYGQPTYG